MPQKRKAQRAAANREAAKRIIRGHLSVCGEERLPPYDDGEDRLPPLDSTPVLEHLSADQIKHANNEDVESEGCSCDFSTVVNDASDVDYVPEEWESDFDLSAIWNSAEFFVETTSESQPPVLQSSIETTQFAEDPWISDLSTVPLLASGTFLYYKIVYARSCFNIYLAYEKLL